MTLARKNALPALVAVALLGTMIAIIPGGQAETLTVTDVTTSGTTVTVALTLTVDPDEYADLSHALIFVNPDNDSGAHDGNLTSVHCLNAASDVQVEGGSETPGYGYSAGEYQLQVTFTCSDIASGDFVQVAVGPEEDEQLRSAIGQYTAPSSSSSGNSGSSRSNQAPPADSESSSSTDNSGNTKASKKVEPQSNSETGEPTFDSTGVTFSNEELGGGDVDEIILLPKSGVDSFDIEVIVSDADATAEEFGIDDNTLSVNVGSKVFQFISIDVSRNGESFDANDVLDSAQVTLRVPLADIQAEGGEPEDLILVAFDDNGEPEANQPQPQRNADGTVAYEVIDGIVVITFDVPDFSAFALAMAPQASSGTDGDEVTETPGFEAIAAIAMLGAAAFVARRRQA